MQFTSFAAVLALAGLAVASPAPNNDNKCYTEWKTSTVTTTSQCPIVSLPLSPIVTGTLVPVGSITSGLGVRAAEPTAPPAVEARNGGCSVCSTKTVTTTVKPSCGVVNPGSIGKLFMS